jgi:hypothetical protein
LADDRRGDAFPVLRTLSALLDQHPSGHDVVALACDGVVATTK